MDLGKEGRRGRVAAWGSVGLRCSAGWRVRGGGGRAGARLPRAVYLAEGTGP